VATLAAFSALVVACGRIGYDETDPGGVVAPDGGIDEPFADRSAESSPNAANDALADGSADGSPGAANDAEVDGVNVDAGCFGDSCVSCTSSAGCTCAGYGGSIYRFCSTPSTWSTAEAACEAAGMRLARVVSEPEDAWIRATGDALAIAYMWLGAEDPMNASIWQWPDGAVFWMGGSAGSPVGGLYSNWNAMHPTGSAIRACGGMIAGQYAGQWDDRSCTSMLAYVCKAY
jgi:hypothetical protein